MMRVRRATIHLRPANIRKNSLLILRIFCNQPFHLSDGRRLSAAVIKRKSHAQNNAALKTLLSIRQQRLRILIAPLRKQKRRNFLHGLTI